MELGKTRFRLFDENAVECRRQADLGLRQMSMILSRRSSVAIQAPIGSMVYNVRRSHRIDEDGYLEQLTEGTIALSPGTDLDKLPWNYGIVSPLQKCFKRVRQDFVYFPFESRISFRFVDMELR